MEVLEYRNTFEVESNTFSGSSNTETRREARTFSRVRLSLKRVF